MIKKRTPHDQLLSLQKKIYRSLSEQATRLLGTQPESIRTYEREYQREFKKLPKTFVTLTREKLIDDIRDSQVTLIGDFHTFAQAQRTALRILRSVQKKGDHWSLALEVFPSHRQKILDDFQNGQINEAKFIEAIRYDEWGFPWEHYAPLIRWAIEARVKLIALNRPHELGTDLHARDQWASGIITDLFLKNPKSQVIVLYGELHLGHSHLPSQLAKTSRSAIGKSLRSIVIHQNQEKVFWRAARDHKDPGAEILKLGRSRYCVLSSTPWNKLQSVVNWAEGAFPNQPLRRDTPEINFKEDDIELHESLNDSHSTIRLITMMRDFAEIQSKFLDIPAPSFEALNLYTIENADYFNKSKLKQLKPADRQLLKFHILHNERVYLPDSDLAYLATPSENSTAEIAAIHLLTCHLKTIKPGEPFHEGGATDFYRWVMNFAFGFMGSLILNPRRKCDLVDDHAERLKLLSQGHKTSYPGELEARKLALTWLDAEQPDDPKALDLLSKLTHSKRTVSVPLFFGARFLGQALAKGLHRVLLQQDAPGLSRNSGPIVTVEDLRRCFCGEDSLPPPYWRYAALRKLSLLEPHDRSKNESL